MIPWKNQSNMINNIRFDTIVGMIVDDAYYYREYDESMFSTYLRKRFYMLSTMLYH